MEQLVQCEHEFMRLKNIGCHLDALRYMELSLNLRKQIFGIESSEVSQACKVLLTSYNTLAMNCLQKEDFAKCYELLKKAEALTEASAILSDDHVRPKLRAVTLNNLGVFYRRKGKLHAALKCVERALKIELISKNVDNPAGTHLNLCAILSQLGRHDQALEHAQCAMELLKQAVSCGKTNQVSSSENTDASIMAVAYHNMAVEQEFLFDFNSALESYSEAVRIADNVWGNDHIKTVALRQSLRQAQAKCLSLTTNDRSHRTQQTSISSVRLPLFQNRSFSQSDSNKDESRKIVNNSLGCRLPNLVCGSKSTEPSRCFVGNIRKSGTITDTSLITECKLTSIGSEIQAWALKNSKDYSSGREYVKISPSKEVITSDGRLSQIQDESLKETIQDMSATMESNHNVRDKHGPKTPTKKSDISHLKFRKSRSPSSSALDSRVGAKSVPLIDHAQNSRGDETHDLSSFDDFSEQISGRTKYISKYLSSVSTDFQKGLGIYRSAGADMDHLHSVKVPATHFFDDSRYSGKRELHDKSDPSTAEKLLLRRLEQLERTIAMSAVAPIEELKLNEIKVKCDNHGDLRLIATRSNVSVAELYDAVMREYGIYPPTEGGISNKTILLKYRDADGDLITLATQPALDIAMEQACRSRPPLLLVSCITSSESAWLQWKSDGAVDSTGCDHQAAVCNGSSINLIESLSLRDKPSNEHLAAKKCVDPHSDKIRQHQLQRCAVTLQCAIRSRSARKQTQHLYMVARSTLEGVGVDKDMKQGRMLAQRRSEATWGPAPLDERAKLSEEGARPKPTQSVEAVVETQISSTQNDFAAVETRMDGGGVSVDGIGDELKQDTTVDSVVQIVMAADAAAGGNEDRRLTLQQAVVVLSCAIRCHLSRSVIRILSGHRKQDREFTSRVMIQTCCRNWLARRRVLHLRSNWAMAHKSACTLQRCYRSRLARLLVKNKRAAALGRQSAAVTVERWVRGHLGRRFARDARQATAQHGLFLGRYQIEQPTEPDTHSAARGAAAALASKSERSSFSGVPKASGKKIASKEKGGVHKDGVRGVRGGHKDGGRGLVTAVLVSQGGRPGSDGMVRALDLKTKKQVLLRVMDDWSRWERERLLQSCLDAGVVAAIVDSFQDVRGDPAMHVLGYLRPDEDLGRMLNGPRMVSSVRMDVCRAVVAAVAYLHSRGVVMVHLEAHDVVQYGTDWKILGLKWARRTGELLGPVEGLELVSTVPEVVAACAEQRVESVKASAALDSWGVGSLMYLVQTGEPLIMSGEEARQVLVDGNGKGRVHAYLEAKIDKVEDVMAKYVVENLVCLDARDRMLLRDALLYAPQMGVVPPDDSSDTPPWMEDAASLQPASATKDVIGSDGQT